MMELDLNELERLAESATQGPWIACGPSFGAALPKYLNEVVVDNPDSEEDGIEICQSPTGLEKESSRDMEFIGAANPAVVLELVRRLREAENDAWRYRKLRDEDAWGEDVALGGGSAWEMLGELHGSNFDKFVDARFQPQKGRD